MLTITVIGWIVLSLIVGSVGEGRRIGFFGGFVACLFLSPLIGLLIIIASPRRDYKNERALSDYNRGHNLLKKGKTEKAIPFLKNAVQSYPSSHLYQIQLSAALSGENQTDQSFFHFKKAVESGFSDFGKIADNKHFDNLRNNEKYKNYIKNGYSENVSTKSTKSDELVKLKNLLDAGAISQEEYDKMKSEIINQ